MKIKGKISLHVKNDIFGCPILKMKVKFNVPNGIFKKVEYKTLFSYYDYKDHKINNKYHEDCLNLLSNREKIIEIGKEMIIEYMEYINKNDNYINKNDEILKMIKNINKEKIKIEFDYNKNKNVNN